MKSRTILVTGLLAAATLAGAAPANAWSAAVDPARIESGSHHAPVQFRWSGDERERLELLSPRQVRRVLRGQGFRAIDYLDRRGRIYEVRATDFRGRRVGLVVNARNGAVLRRTRL